MKKKHLLFLPLILCLIFTISVGPVIAPRYLGAATLPLSLGPHILYLEKEDLYQLDTSALPSGPVTYVSVDPTIASVDQSGLITGLKTGITNILIIQETASQEIEVRVNYGTYLRKQTVLSEEREDYPDLTDEEYANFRAISTTGMKKNTLYRSSSPISSALHRNTQADAACKKAGIRTVINLADTKSTLVDHSSYEGSYYSTLKICCLHMDTDFLSESFQKKLVKGLKYMIKKKGPYLVHCTYGRDRTGFVCAILECLMGASREEVLLDYMLTYVNYNRLSPSSSMYKGLSRHIMEEDLMRAFKVSDLSKADLSAEATDYLLQAGLTEAEIDSLKKVLGN